MKSDCVGNKPGVPYCTILTEKLCEHKESCPFYKTRESAAYDRFMAAESLKVRGMRPVVRVINGVPCQSVVKVP